MSDSTNNTTTAETSWTPQEVQKWKELNLIPEELFNAFETEKLSLFLSQNIEMLRQHYHRNFDEDHYICRVPPPEEWDKAPDIVVIDKRTNEVVSILEMITNFTLCEGISLKIKKKEQSEWEKETEGAKKLTKEQTETLAATLNVINEKEPGRPLSRKEITDIIEGVRKPQKKTFRQAREIIDNKLDRSLNKDQQTVFDSTPIIKGLDLDQSEDRILQVLSLLLHEKSENKDQKSPYYYMGNYEKGIVSVNQVEMETARMAISPHEFYSKYYGKDSYNSEHIKFLLNKLDGLSKKMFQTSWKFPTGKKNKKGVETFTLFRTNLALFQMALLNEDLSEVACNEIMTNELILEGKRCKIIFKFQPQFTNHIKTRYVEFPEDLHLRIGAVVGKDRYGQHINLMRDFLLREKQAAKRNKERCEFFRDKETIIDILKLDKYWKECKKKVVAERIQECVDVYTKLGLLLDWEETKGSNGQDQYRIKINPDFK